MRPVRVRPPAGGGAAAVHSYDLCFLSEILRTRERDFRREGTARGKTICEWEVETGMEQQADMLAEDWEIVE